MDGAYSAVSSSKCLEIYLKNIPSAVFNPIVSIWKFNLVTGRMFIELVPANKDCATTENGRTEQVLLLFRSKDEANATLLV